MPLRRAALAGLGLLAMLPLSMIEAFLAPGGYRGAIAPAAFADDDDGDDDDRPMRRGGRILFDDDDDDVRPVRPRREAPRGARRASQRVTARPEIVAAGVTADALARIRAAGFTVLAERRLAVLPETTVRLAPPRNLSGPRARARLADLAPGALVDDNALYSPNAAATCPEGACFPYRVEDWSVPICAARGAVGLIDTRVDAAHPAFEGRAIETASTRGEGRPPSSPEHGTEVAILLAGQRAEPDDLKLVAVDAFHHIGRADRADVFDLVAAIDLMAERKVAVVNLSLAGPPNTVLDRAGAIAAERGLILVAAVGNDGPNAGPRYPAAYRWAVAVTAVDAGGKAYARAGRGAHVAFAAPGVRLELPDGGLRPGKQRSGTSYAAPLVTAALSAITAQGGGRPKAQVVAALAAAVEDSGAPGRDPVFGWGALAPERGCPGARRAEAR